MRTSARKYRLAVWLIRRMILGMAATRPRRLSVRLKTSGQTQLERDRIAVGVIESLLDAQMGHEVECPTCKKGHVIKELSQATLTAMRIRYDKLRPALSAVEQTNIDPEESLTEQQLMDRLLALIDAHPDLVQRALAARARQQTGVTLGVTQDDAIKKAS